MCIINDINSVIERKNIVAKFKEYEIAGKNYYILSIYMTENESDVDAYDVFIDIMEDFKDQFPHKDASIGKLLNLYPGEKYPYSYSYSWSKIATLDKNKIID